MRNKLFTLTRSPRDDLWRRDTQITERRVAEWRHAILLLDEVRSAHDVSTILHPKTLKRWIAIFATRGGKQIVTFNYVGNTSWMNDAHIQQFSAWRDAQVRRTKEAIAWAAEHFGMEYTKSGMLKFIPKVACSNS